MVSMTTEIHEKQNKFSDMAQSQMSNSEKEEEIASELICLCEDDVQCFHKFKEKIPLSEQSFLPVSFQAGLLLEDKNEFKIQSFDYLLALDFEATVRNLI